MPQAAVIIPARWESTRFPGKPLHLIAGKPLLRHVWERCLEAEGIERVVVATDHERIAQAATGFGAEVVLTSPDHPSGTDRIAEAARQLPGISHIVNVQGDEPLIDPGLISEFAQTIMDDASIEMLTAANKLETEEEAVSPHVVKVVLDRGRNALYFSRSLIPYPRTSDIVPVYRHQGIYGYTAAFLQEFVHWPPGLLEQAEGLEQLRALENGRAIRVIITAHRSLGVDVPEDVAAVEAELSLLTPES